MSDSYFFFSWRAKARHHLESLGRIAWCKFTKQWGWAVEWIYQFLLLKEIDALLSYVVSSTAVGFTWAWSYRKGAVTTAVLPWWSYKSVLYAQGLMKLGSCIQQSVQWIGGFLSLKCSSFFDRAGKVLWSSHPLAYYSETIFSTHKAIISNKILLL